VPTDVIEILIRATGVGFEWLSSSVRIMLKATPMFGVPVFVLMMGFIVLFLGWNLLHERG